MNKIDKVIESLENSYNINVMDLIEDYGAMCTLEQMAAKYNTTVYTIYTILTVLQLRRKKKHRELDYKLIKAAILDAKDVKQELIDDLFDAEREIKELRRQVTQKEEALIKARIELRRHRADDRKQYSSSHSIESLTDALDRVAESIASSKDEITYLPVKRSDELPKQGLVAVISDWHIGEVVDITDVGTNEYNYKIAKQRVNKFIDSVLMYPRQSNELFIMSLKDDIRGIIHNGSNETEGGIIKSITTVVDMYVNMLSIFAATYDKVTLVSVGTGNHERLTEWVASTGKSLDYGKLIDEMLLRVIRAAGLTNVEVIRSTTGYCLTTINNSNIITFHGDTLRKYTPSNTLQRSVLQDVCTNLFGVPYRHAISGHTHSGVIACNQFDGLNISSGALVGSNAFGVTSGFSNISPTQTIVFVETDGSIQDTRVVNLDSDALSSGV